MTGPPDEPKQPPPSAAEVANAAGSTPIESLDDLQRRDLRQDIGLKRTYAYGALIGMGVQLAVADWVFFLYGRGVDWRIPTPAISAWLGATVIEVVGVVFVITKYLFPARAKD